MQTGDVTGKVIKVADQEEAENQVLCAYAFDGLHIVGTSVSYCFKALSVIRVTLRPNTHAAHKPKSYL